MSKPLSVIILNKTKPLAWKNKIRAETNRLIARREIKYKDCQIGKNCEGRMEVHHRNYNNPKLVYFLCNKHHVEIHRQSREDGMRKWLVKYIPKRDKRELEQIEKFIKENEGVKISPELRKRYKYLKNEYALHHHLPG